MGTELSGKKIAFLVAPEGVEQVELTGPWKAIEESGGSPQLISTEPGQVQGFNHLDRGERFPVDATVNDIDVGDYDGLVLPGGVANPDFLRTEPDAVGLVRDFVTSGKPLGVICHGPWTLIEADVMRGRTITSWPSLQTDLRNAGANWVDEELVICDAGPNTIISSRKPDDLKAFTAAIVETFAD